MVRANNMFLLIVSSEGINRGLGMNQIPLETRILSSRRTRACSIHQWSTQRIRSSSQFRGSQKASESISCSSGQRVADFLTWHPASAPNKNPRETKTRQELLYPRAFRGEKIHGYRLVEQRDQQTPSMCEFAPWSK